MKDGIVTIRTMARSDTEAVHIIHSRCLAETLANRYNDEQLQAWKAGRSPEGYWEAAVSGERFLVLERENIVVGYASWKGDELVSLFVHPDHQGRGYGSRLFHSCCAAAGQSTIRLVFVKAALGAEGFYRHHGFEAESPGYTEKRGVRIPDTRMRRRQDQVGSNLVR